MSPRALLECSSKDFQGAVYALRRFCEIREDEKRKRDLWARVGRAWFFRRQDLPRWRTGEK